MNASAAAETMAYNILTKGFCTECAVTFGEREATEVLHKFVRRSWTKLEVLQTEAG